MTSTIDTGDGADAREAVDGPGFEALGVPERLRWPRSSGLRVSLVIPAINEAENLAIILPRLPEIVDEVILVDGNSTDETVAVTRTHCPDVRVVGQDRPGKGAALRAGFAAARGEIIVMIDADGSMDPEEIGRFLAPLDEGYDMVKGSRFQAGGGTSDMEFSRRMGNRVLCGMVNQLYQVRFTDLCYGFFAFRRNRLPELALECDGFEIETEIVVRAINTGLEIAEVPSFEAARIHGESNLHTFRDGRRVLKTLLQHRFARRPRENRLEARVVTELITQPQASGID
jgi:glycosyltransferase involved in cell wall biosynthesis